MKKVTAYQTIQNVSVSTLAFHCFTIAYHAMAKRKKKETIYPKLQYFFYVLPLLYHEQSLDNFYRSNNLSSVIDSYPQIITQLQHRANKFSSQTFDALNLAFNVKILDLDHNDSKYFIKPVRKSELQFLDSLDITKICTGARKLGIMFSKIPEQTLELKLKITF